MIRYIDDLQDFVDSYNNTYHRSIGMRPSEVNPENADAVRKKLFKKESRKSKKVFRIGDYVRLSLKKRMFKKGYLQNYTEEIFKVSKVFKERYPVMYKIEDLQDEEIDDRFYKEELQRVSLPKTFIVEQVLKTKKQRGRNFYLIRWRGYPPQFDEWIAESQLEAI